jgi:hypothetical protein
LKFIVVSDFIDKDTKELHKTNTEYSTIDKTRAEELKGLGFIKENEIMETKKENEKTILDKNVPKIIKEINYETPKKALEALLKAEKKGKNRTTIIEHIESLLV